MPESTATNAASYTTPRDTIQRVDPEGALERRNQSAWRAIQRRAASINR